MVSIVNDNNIFYENIELKVQFPGIITDEIVHFDNGVIGYDIWIGRGPIFYNITTVNYTTCYSTILIEKMMPNADFIAVFSIDIDIYKYSNICWCKPIYENYDPIFSSNLENRFEINYTYQEYGFYYYDNFKGNFSTPTISPIE
jgi:hypothetical protein